jgi:site-specific recombinase XerD
MAEAVQMWAISLRAANIAPRTVAQYRYALGVAMDVIGHDVHLPDITRADVEALVVNLMERGWKPASVSSVWRPLRTFFGWAVERTTDTGLSSSPMVGMKPPIVPVEPAEFPSADELRRVIAATVTTSRHAFRSRRDEAILRMFASCGVRLAELANLTMGELQLGQFPTATVLGKGRKVRTVPLDEPTVDAIRAYLTRERPRSPYAASERVWLASKGPMTASGIAQMVADRGKASGVPLHPHALRHFAIDGMLRAGMSEGDTMAVSGHSSRSMMDRYGALRRAERADVAFRAAGRAML